jgi:peptidoglycan hydrolase-like protein with peptidoglycan-binding domain
VLISILRCANLRHGGILLILSLISLVGLLWLPRGYLAGSIRLLGSSGRQRCNLMGTGRIDGIPGKMTYTAMQKWAGVKADGIIGPNTRRAVQSKLGVKPDGKWDKLTISELQRQLNTGKI